MPEDLAHVVRRHLVAVVDTGLALPGLVQQVHFAQEQACRHHRREHRDRFHLGLPRGERGHGRAKPEAGQRHALDLRGALQPAHRLHHLGHPVLGAHPAAGVARIAGAQIIEAQHRDAAQGQAVGELAHRLVQPHRLVAEGIAKDDPVVAAGGVQPPGMSVENDRFHFGVRSLMDESLWPLTEALRFARGAPSTIECAPCPQPRMLRYAVHRLNPACNVGMPAFGALAHFDRRAEAGCCRHARGTVETAAIASRGRECWAPNGAAPAMLLR